jgi:methionyl-tRNA formyltransferase
MKNKFKIAFAGCKDTTYECIKLMLQEGYMPTLLITISPEMARKNNVSGYMDLNQFARDNNIQTYICDSYSLKSEKDKDFLSENEIDLLLVIGWQRLIPEWLLVKLSIGAFGMHGSSQALPFGRGRSPLNWSIIQDRELFITNLFKYNPGIDDGDILDTEVFDINLFDNGKTLHYKNTLAMVKLLKKNLNNLLQKNFELKRQLDIDPTYYPKRTTEDGIIFWNKSTKEIYNLIRAVTKPFPGAFTFYEESKIMIWNAFPFDTRLFDPNIIPGKILHIFRNGDFLVKTGNGTILVVEYEFVDKAVLKTGDFLNSANYVYKNPFNYPE